ncbi:MAG: hypothetical protein NWE98_08980 [Candidatus Bathyarchaeota archaeon]|nr:hypothetical protein [Candidatus Bathyarchaeota archaeon]
MTTLSYVGYILVLIGGILLVISGLLYIIGSPFFAYSALGIIGGVGAGIVQLVLGLICIVGAKYVGTLVWAIVLLIVGIIAGGFGAILVVLGALLGLISSLTHHTYL